MPEQQNYDFEKLAREIVTNRLKGQSKAAENAAEIARKMIVAGVNSTKVRQEPRATVSGICRGIMSGMLLNEGDLARTAVLILREMANISHQVLVSPSDLMTWSMEGIASVALVAGHQAYESIRAVIEENFMDAGKVFSEVYDALRRQTGR